MVAAKSCLVCGKPVKGRSDKKFCSDYCRNNYNNRMKGSNNNYVRNINNVLRKNRNILETILADEESATCKVAGEKMHRLGFQFTYSTHTYITKTGKTYVYCYEYGYLPLDNDCYLVVKRKEQ